MHIICPTCWAALWQDLANTSTRRAQRPRQTPLTCSSATGQHHALLEGRGAGVLDTPPGRGHGAEEDGAMGARGGTD